MKKFDPAYAPVMGKTYSLFGNSESTEQYYNSINRLTDIFFNYYSAVELKDLINRHIPIQNYIKKFFDRYSNDSGLDIHNQLNIYTTGVKQHLKELSILKSWDRTLRTKEDNYHLFMLENEINNRLDIEDFKITNYKIALLPHCLRDLNKNCKAQIDEIDLVCKACSKDCFINFASRVLKEKNINPYIWMNINQKNLFKSLMKKYGSIGVLGIACLPELINGMRSCIKRGIPAVGIPLNANRCMRWMGEYYENSFSVEKLEELVS